MDDARLKAAEARIKDLETVLQMVRDSDISKYQETGEFRNGQIVRKEIQRVLDA